MDVRRKLKKNLLLIYWEIFNKLDLNLVILPIIQKYKMTAVTIKRSYGSNTPTEQTKPYFLPNKLKFEQ